MDYWNDIITEKSWGILQEIRKLPINFILIGGWANYLWTKTHKSKDIDIVIVNFEDLNFLKKNYDLKKNNNLKKYEIKIESIDIDIYVPYYSKLSIPVEDLAKYSTKVQNFNVVSPEALLILKQGAEIDRGDSIKGKKDRIDIMSLLLSLEINFEKYNEMINKYNLDDFRQRLKKIIMTFNDVEYLDLNIRELKIKKRGILNRL